MGQMNEVEVVLTRPLHGELSRCREADQRADAGAHGLVDQFQAAATGDHDEAFARLAALQRQRADQLVQRVMPADVLTAEGDLSVAVDIQRRVQRTAVARHQLGARNALAQLMEMPFGRQCCRLQRHQPRQCLIQRIHPAESAAAGAGELATLLLECPERPRADLYVRAASAAVAEQAQVTQVIESLDQPASEAEADDELFQILRRHHHHGVVQTVVADGQRAFLGQQRSACIVRFGGVQSGVEHGGCLRQVDAGSLGAPVPAVQSLCPMV
ncbi:hypothetical protein PszF2a_23030 [Stutzerimonas stutzeri]|nr:hypothetical protein PszF2a_23030 [Stutzerimonas stutzeri]